jgi:uncharacterized protein (DUF58 family)
VSAAPTLVPPTVSGPAQSLKRTGFGFGHRFFILFALGLVWTAAALLQARFLYAALTWDGVVLLAWLVDLITLPSPSRLKIAREWTAPAALSVRVPVGIRVENSTARTVHLAMRDDTPPQLRETLPELGVSVGPKNQALVTYNIVAHERGEAQFGDVYARYQSPLRLAEWWARVKLGQKVRVYPDLDEARRHAIYLVRSRQIEMEKRQTRRRGTGREFESLREYRPGDEFRDICWSATARRGRLVTRIYQIERSQTIWIVLDAGRLMRARVGSLNKLDYATNGALSLAQVALLSGDRVGLLTYGRRILQRVPAARGSAHLRQLIEQLALVKEESSEADHLLAAGNLLSGQRRRSLIVWLTDLAETAMTPEVVEAASRMMPHHLVLFAVIGQPDLAVLAGSRPEKAGDMFRAAAAQEVVHRREKLLARLRERGALALEVNSGELASRLVNSYLEIKERSRL